LAIAITRHIVGQTDYKLGLMTVGAGHLFQLLSYPLSGAERKPRYRVPAERVKPGFMTRVVKVRRGTNCSTWNTRAALCLCSRQKNDYRRPNAAVFLTRATKGLRAHADPKSSPAQPADSSATSPTGKSHATEATAANRPTPHPPRYSETGRADHQLSATSEDPPAPPGLH